MQSNMFWKQIIKKYLIGRKCNSPALFYYKDLSWNPNNITVLKVKKIFNVCSVCV